jgi:hypothetical protein
VAAQFSGTLTEALSYDAPVASTVGASGNRGATGAASVTVYGANFGAVDATSAMAAGQTACEATVWVNPKP